MTILIQYSCLEKQHLLPSFMIFEMDIIRREMQVQLTGEKATHKFHILLLPAMHSESTRGDWLVSPSELLLCSPRIMFDQM